MRFVAEFFFEPIPIPFKELLEEALDNDGEGVGENFLGLLITCFVEEPIDVMLR